MKLRTIDKQDLAIIKEFFGVEKQIKELQKHQKDLRADLVDIMEDYQLKSWENDMFKVTYIAPSTGKRIDSVLLRRDHPDLVEEYEVETKRRASVRVTLRG